MLNLVIVSKAELAKEVETEECECHVLVTWDSSTGSIAHEGCPEAHLGQIVMVKVGQERNFEHELEITDAQYTVMDLPEDYEYPDNRNVTIYSNLVEFDGFAPETPMVPKNSYCTVHERVTASDSEDKEIFDSITEIPEDEDSKDKNKDEEE